KVEPVRKHPPQQTHPTLPCWASGSPLVSEGRGPLPLDYCCSVKTCTAGFAAGIDVVAGAVVAVDIANEILLEESSENQGVRLEALDRLRSGFETRPSGLKWPALEPAGPEANGLGALLEVIVVVTTVASEP
ncbi:hypothetical protein QQP08_001259, partial [Theobroma cacao]